MDNYEQPTQKTEAEEKAEKQKKMKALSRWFARLDESKNFRANIARTYDWESSVKEFHGDFELGKFGLTDIYIPPLNFIFAYVQSEVPSLYIRDPHIKVNAKNEKSIASAKIIEKAVNYLWRHNRLKRENSKNVQDGLLVGHSWFKTGYAGEFGTVEEANGNTYEFVEKDNFFGYRVPWDAVLFSPDSLDPPYDCRWMAHEIWAPIDEVKENPLYKNTQYLQPSNMNNQASNVTGAKASNKFKPSEDMVCLYEVWDKKTMTVFTIAPGCFEYIREPQPWPYEMRGYPFSYLCFNPSPTQPYGVPDVYTFRPQVLELMKLRAQMLDHIKRFNRQYIVTKGAISDDSMAALKQGITGAIVEIDDIKAIKVLEYGQLQPDIYNIEMKIKEDAINISGQSPQERGATQQTSTRTFRELAEIKKGAENRRSRKIDVVEDFVEDIAGNLIAIMQQFADVPFYVRTTGEEFQEIQQALASRPSAQKQGAEAGPNGFTFTKEDIQGEFDLDVVAGSTAPLDKAETMNILTSMIPELPALGVTPGGPVAGAIGNMLAENLDMPELQAAIKLEGQMNQQRAEQAAKQAQDAQDMMIAEKTGKMQLDAEKVAIKQNDLLLKAVQHATQPGEKPEAPKEEDKGPSESIAFKDLPPEGQVQMARQAGITLTPEQMVKHQENVNKQQAKKEAKKKPKGE